MKNIINAIKNYVKEYNKIQAEWMNNPGYYHYMAQMNAMVSGFAFY